MTPRVFRDEWPPPLYQSALEKAAMPVSATPEQIAEGVWCGTCGRMVPVTATQEQLAEGVWCGRCGRMVPVTDKGFLSGVCWFVALHGRADDPCPWSGMPCDGERP